MEDLKDIKIEAKPDYLLVEVGGTFSLEFAFKVIDVSLERSIAHKKNKILYDFRNMAGKITMLDRYEVGKYAQKSIPHVNFSAIVGRKDQSMFGGVMGSFLENVLSNRGVRARVFTEDEGSAVAWLTNAGSEE